MSFHSTVERHLAARYSGLSPPPRRTDGAHEPGARRSLDAIRSFRADRARDALDMGCGDGIATAAALARGARVYAVDCDQAALHQLLARVPAVHAPRLRARIGTLPGANFKYPRFSAVHVSRVFQFLDPLAVQRSLQKFLHWLYPKGKLFLSTLRLRVNIGSSRRAKSSERSSRAIPLPWDIDQMCCAVVARCVV